MRTFVFISNIPLFLLEPLTEDPNAGQNSRHPARKTHRDLAYERLHQLLAAHTSGLMLTMHVKGKRSGAACYADPMKLLRERGGLRSRRLEQEESVRGPRPYTGARSRREDIATEEEHPPPEGERSEEVEIGYGLALYASEAEALAACKAVIYPDGKEGLTEDAKNGEQPPTHAGSSSAEQGSRSTPPASSVSSSTSRYSPLKLRILKKEAPPAPEEVYRSTITIEGKTVEKSSLATTRGLERAYRGLMVPRWCPQTEEGKDCVFGTSCHKIHLLACQKTVHKRPAMGGVLLSSARCGMLSERSVEERHPKDTAREKIHQMEKKDLQEEEGSAKETGIQHIHKEEEEEEEEGLWSRMSQEEAKWLSHTLQQCIQVRVVPTPSTVKVAPNGKKPITVLSLSSLRTPSLLLPTTVTCTVVYDTLVPGSLRWSVAIPNTLALFQRRQQQQLQREARRRRQVLESPSEDTPRATSTQATTPTTTHPSISPFRALPPLSSVPSPTADLSPSQGHTPHAKVFASYAAVNTIHLLPKPIAIPLLREEVDQWLLGTSPRSVANTASTTSVTLTAKQIEARVAARIQAALPVSPAATSGAPYLFFARLSLPHGGAPWDWALHDPTVGLPLLSYLCPYPSHGTPTPLERDVLEQRIWFWLNQLNAFTTGEDVCRALRCSPRVREAVKHQRCRLLAQQRRRRREAEEKEEATHEPHRGEVEDGSAAGGVGSSSAGGPLWSIQLLPWLYLPTTASEGASFLEITNETERHDLEEEEAESGSHHAPPEKMHGLTSSSAVTRSGKRESDAVGASSRTHCDGIVQRHGALRVMTSEPLLREAIMEGVGHRHTHLQLLLQASSPGSFIPHTGGMAHGHEKDTSGYLQEKPKKKEFDRTEKEEATHRKESDTTGEPTATRSSSITTASSCITSLSQYFMTICNTTLQRVAVPQRGVDLPAEHHLEDTLKFTSQAFSFATETMRRHLEQLHQTQPWTSYFQTLQAAKGEAHVGRPHAKTSSVAFSPTNTHLNTGAASLASLSTGASTSSDLLLPPTTAVAIDLAMFTPPLLSPLLLLHAARLHHGIASPLPLPWPSLPANGSVAPVHEYNHNATKDDNEEDSSHVPTTTKTSFPLKEEEGLAIRGEMELLNAIRSRALLYTTGTTSASLSSSTTTTLTSTYPSPHTTLLNGRDNAKGSEEEIPFRGEVVSPHLPVLPVGTPLVVSFHTYGNGIASSFWMNRLCQEIKQRTTSSGTPSLQEEGYGGSMPAMLWNTTRHAYEPLFSVEVLKRLRKRNE